MIVYILTWRHPDYIPHILDGLQRFAPDVREVAFVRDSKPDINGSDYGARDVFVPDAITNSINSVHNMMNYLLTEEISRQVDPHALVIHSDIVPIAPFDPASLLAGHQVAGRGHDNVLTSPYAWILFDTKLCQGNWSMERLTRRKVYDFHRFQGSCVPKFLTDAGYVQDISMEFCEPCWLHSDKVSYAHADPTFRRKVEIIGNVMQSPPNPMEMPTILDQLRLYTKQRLDWYASGKPERGDKEIQLIYRICSTCRHRTRERPGALQCSLTGCEISKDRNWMSLNTRATTSCPLNPPQWVATTKPVPGKLGCC